MSLKARLESGDIVGPPDFPKTSITSMVSQLRKQGYEIETLGDCRYRLVNGNGNGQAAAEEEQEQEVRRVVHRRKRPPLPGEHLVLDLTITELYLDEEEKLMVAAVDGAERSITFPW